MNTQATKEARRPAAAPPAPRLLRRRCACGGTPGPDGECAACRAKRLRRERLQGAASASPGQAPPLVGTVLRSSAPTLDPAVAAELGARLGHDFGRVRVHTDARAAESARVVGAAAYSVGRDVVFGSGRYAPHTSEGRRLLAHELAHVAQSGEATDLSGPLMVGRADSRHEREAEEAARRAMGASAPGAAAPPPLSLASPPLVQRQASASAALGATAVGASVSSPGDAFPAPAPSGGGGGGACKIEVGATHIGGILSVAPIWHTLVIYTDAGGAEYYYRAGPGGSCPGVTAGSYGTIKSTSGRYLPGTVDYPASYRTTVMTGAGACGKDSCFASELSRIDGLCTPYAPTGPNSNTVARTLLANCGVPQAKPVSIAPGWDDPVL